MRPTASRVEASFYVDRRLSHSINKGDVLNVYRKKRLSRQIRHPIRIYIGTLWITDSQEVSAIGVFEPNASVGAAEEFKVAELSGWSHRQSSSSRVTPTQTASRDPT